MPVTNQTTMNSYAGNGVTVLFAYGFKIFVNTDLKVTVDGVVKTLTTDYTVSGVGADGGGNVTFTSPPANLSVVTISREVPFARSTDYINNGDLQAQTLDDDIDRAIMLIQQLWRDVKRAIKLPVEETNDKGVTTTAANRANKVMAFDAAGSPAVRPIADLSALLTAIDNSLTQSGSTLSVTKPNRSASAGGTADAITAVFSPVITALTDNLEVVIEPTAANATSTPTFAPDGLTAKIIVKGSGETLLPGDIQGVNSRARLVFDVSLDRWVLLNPYYPPSTYGKITAHQSGAYTFATAAGTNTYTATLAPVPLAYATMGVCILIPNANTGAATLNLNGLGAKNILRPGGGALLVGDITANHLAILDYNGSEFILQNPFFVKGTTTNDDAPVGAFGEYGVMQRAPGSAVALTSNTVANITSITLPPGDWDVSGVIDFVCSGATISHFDAGISTVSATLGAQDTYVSPYTAVAGLTATVSWLTPPVRLSLAATTTVYLVGSMTIGAGSATAYGTIRARRAR